MVLAPSRSCQEAATSRPCGVPLLGQACDLGSVGYIASDGVLKLSVFKVRGAIPERVQATLETRSGSETRGQVRGPDEFSAPTGSAATGGTASEEQIADLEGANGLAGSSGAAPHCRSGPPPRPKSAGVHSRALSPVARTTPWPLLPDNRRRGVVGRPNR